MSPEEMLLKLAKLAKIYGLSLDDPAAGWKLALILANKHEPDFKERAQRGQKADPHFTVDDLILYAGVEIGLQDPDATVKPLIRSLAKHNGWPTDETAVETKRQRYYKLKKRGSREEQNAARLAQTFLPALEARLAELEKK